MNFFVTINSIPIPLSLVTLLVQFVLFNLSSFYVLCPIREYLYMG